MSRLTNRGPYANQPVKLPSLQAARAQDPNAQRALEALREWVEVRLGSRGDFWERAVTQRDMEQAIEVLRTRLAALEAAAGVVAGAAASTASSTDLSLVIDGLSTLRAEADRSKAAIAALQAAVARFGSYGDFFSDVAAAVVGELVVFSDTSGKRGTRATGTGYAKLTSGVLSADSAATVRGDLQGDGSAADMVGFRGIPMTSRSADYTLVLSDAGKGTLHPASDANARTFTIPANASVAFPVGTAHTFVNETAEVVTIAITSDTLLLGGTTTTGSRSLAQNGVATALKITATKWVISGAGLT